MAKRCPSTILNSVPTEPVSPLEMAQARLEHGRRLTMRAEADLEALGAADKPKAETVIPFPTSGAVLATSRAWHGHGSYKRELGLYIRQLDDETLSRLTGDDLWIRFKGARQDLPQNDRVARRVAEAIRRAAVMQRQQRSKET